MLLFEETSDFNDDELGRFEKVINLGQSITPHLNNFFDDFSNQGLDLYLTEISLWEFANFYAMVCDFRAFCPVFCHSFYVYLLVKLSVLFV